MVKLPSFRSWSRRQLISALLSIAGFALLIYVGSEYFTMYHQQKELTARWQQEQQQAQHQAVTAMTVNTDVPESQPDPGLTRITSSAIDLDAIVVEGTSHRELRLGPGHIPGTAEPGEPGNAVISAHRDTFFRHIYDLKQGDTVEVQRNGRTYRYAVTSKKIVSPDDVSVLNQTEKPTLTLITCYPIYYIGPAPKRLIVRAQLIDDSKQEAATARAAGAP